MKSGSPELAQQITAIEQIARGITPEPNIMRLAETCGRRAATAPPDTSRPIAIAKRAPRRGLSEIPKTPTPLVPRRSKLSPIEGSPEPKGGGKKRRTRRRTRKH